MENNILEVLNRFYEESGAPLRETLCDSELPPEREHETL